MSIKLKSGGGLPDIVVPKVGGGEIRLGHRIEGAPWQVIIVYRGLHCPLCNQYLARLEELREAFLKAGAELVAISGDPVEKAEAMVEKHKLSFPVGYDLSIEQMKELGLYISQPRSADETDRPFAEPGTFGVDERDALALIEISNTPFNRADLSELVETVEWVRENNYPIRGNFEG